MRNYIKQTQPFPQQFDEDLFLTHQTPDALVGPAAKARWMQTILVLADEGRRIPRSHEGALLGYCSAFQLLADCEASLATDGLLIDGGRDGKRRSPALGGKLSALTAIRQFGSELGLSTQSASRLPLPPISPEPNEFDGED